MNYRVPRTRKEIFETLIKGLQRLEYRGYDSAGVAIDGNNDDVKERYIQLVKKRGKVKALDEELYSKWRASEREEPVRHRRFLGLDSNSVGHWRFSLVPAQIHRRRVKPML
ncbi:PREDICTED: glutamine--fructose-6-phosphate aminotransferase [isomerizing] 2-like [Mandrillus leucophaeus]|uniref:glutamine--fructose-6-phosphate aminotransferase [isomerizing] 2-like n=1 Tax=Mandrillus leucophaeus TaxID=9568 RepID=UPI0005F4BC98|nr:PREDICTED: glutamine--fructose-6-phosphate aminotransferase [isomerizing] 2-like [Mandrillus leucophaeus]